MALVYARVGHDIHIQHERVSTSKHKWGSEKKLEYTKRKDKHTRRDVYSVWTKAIIIILSTCYSKGERDTTKQ